MKIKKGFLVRQVGGENVAVPVGEQAKNFHGMIKLNETALLLWSFFEKEHTEQEAVEYLLGQFDAQPSLVQKDVSAFIKTVQEHGLLV